MLKELLLKIANDEKLDENEKSDLNNYASSIEDNLNFVEKFIRPLSNNFNQDAIKLPFFPIYNQPLEAPLSTFTIQIPTTAKHLFCIGSGRCTGATYNEGVIGRFNGDSGNNYRGGWDGGQNTTQLASQLTGQSQFFFGDFTASLATAGAVGSFFAFLPHIRSNLWKSILSLRGVSEYSATDLFTLFYTAHWQSTVPIQSITFSAGLSTLDTGSLFSIYGFQ